MDENDDRPFTPDWYSPPGDTIEAVMKERGMTLDQFAQKMGQHPLWCASLLCGSERITPELAQKLSEVIGSTPGFWERREATYRKDKKRITGSD